MSFFLEAAFSALGAFAAFSVPASDIDDLTGLLREADLAAVAQYLPADARGAARLGIDMREIGDVHRRFLADDAALRLGALLGMALDQIDAGDQRALVF